MSESAKKARMSFSNIHITEIVRYRMPPSAYVSILHRISGALMFLLLPFVLYLLEKSLTSEISFDYLREFASHWFVKLIILALAWAYLHHFTAGVRHLFMDAHIGLTKDGSRKTATGVLVVSLVLTALVALKLFGAF
jgi:succinate dehydrogenase / fumarate reductase cytochrome b subunit